MSHQLNPSIAPHGLRANSRADRVHADLDHPSPVDAQQTAVGSAAEHLTVRRTQAAGSYVSGIDPSTSRAGNYMSTEPSDALPGNYTSTDASSNQVGSYIDAEPKR